MHVKTPFLLFALITSVAVSAQPVSEPYILVAQPRWEFPDDERTLSEVVTRLRQAGYGITVKRERITTHVRLVKKGGQLLSGIVVDQLAGCESWNENCVRQLQYLNRRVREGDIVSPDFEGELTLPKLTSRYTIVITSLDEYKVERSKEVVRYYMSRRLIAMLEPVRGQEMAAPAWFCAEGNKDCARPKAELIPFN